MTLRLGRSECDSSPETFETQLPDPWRTKRHTYVGVFNCGSLKMKAGSPEPLLAERAESPCQAASVVTTEDSKQNRFVMPVDGTEVLIHLSRMSNVLQHGREASHSAEDNDGWQALLTPCPPDRINRALCSGTRSE